MTEFIGGVVFTIAALYVLIIVFISVLTRCAYYDEDNEFDKDFDTWLKELKEKEEKQIREMKGEQNEVTSNSNTNISSDDGSSSVLLHSDNNIRNH